MEPPTTFSNSRSEILTGNHEYKILGYSSLYKALGTNNYIQSTKFDAAGYEWTIRIYPNGSNGQNNGYVSLFLGLVSNDNNEVNACYEFTIVDQSGNNQHKVQNMTGLFKGQEEKSMLRGLNRFMEKSVLETSNYIKDDCLLIRCCIRVIKSITEEPKIYNVAVPPSNIDQQLGQLLESGEASDIRFEVSGETFAAHKCILVARSRVFRAQLVGPMKDDDTKECIKIADMEATVFKALLHFIYKDVVPADLDYLFAQHLLEAADRYGLERLRLICESKLSEGVSIDNAVTTLALAEQHHCFKLKLVCFRFIAQKQNLKVVMQTDSFKHLRQTFPYILDELLQYAVLGPSDDDAL